MLEVPWEAGQRPRVGPAPAGKGSYPGSEPLAIKHSASNVGVSYSMSELYEQTTNCTFLCGPAKITLRSDLPRSGRCLLWTKVFENNIKCFFNVSEGKSAIHHFFLEKKNTGPYRSRAALWEISNPLKYLIEFFLFSWFGFGLVGLVLHSLIWFGWLSLVL